MIGWLLDTIVVAEIISPGGSQRVKGWAAGEDEATLHLSILTIGEYEKGIANLPDDEPRRSSFMALRDSLVERFGERLLPVSNAIVRRWGIISGHTRRETGHPLPVIDTLLAATAIEYTSGFKTLKGAAEQPGWVEKSCLDWFASGVPLAHRHGRHLTAPICPSSF